MVRASAKAISYVPGLSQIVVLLAVLVEVLWAFPWLAWISQWPTLGWQAPPLNFISCAAQALVSGFIMRRAVQQNWSLGRLRWIGLPLVVLCLLLLIRLNNGGGYDLWDGGWLGYASSHLSALISAFVFGVYLSWRGISANRQELTFSDLYRRFMLGVAALIALLVVWGLARAQIPSSWSAIGVYIVFFFGVGLFSLALSNLVTLRNELLKHQEASKSFSRRWLSILLLLVLAILGLAVVVAGIFSSDFISVILHGLSVFADWLLIGLSYLLYPVGLLATALYYVIRWIINLLRGGAQPPDFVMPTLSDLQKQAEGQAPAQFPLLLLLILKWGLLLLLVVFLIFLLARALVRFWQGKDLENLEDEHESFFTWGLLRGDLHSLWSWLFSWLKRRKRQQELQEDRRELEMIGTDANKDYDVRELYRALLRQGSLLGAPRLPSQTPYEYQRQLQHLHPESAPELEPLTEAYIRERYGEGLGPKENLTVLNRLWRSLRAKLSGGSPR